EAATDRARRRRRRTRWSVRGGQTRCTSASGATTRPTLADDTTADDRACSVVRRSSRAPGQEQRLDPASRAGELVLLDGARGIHVLGAHLRTLADESALPDAIVLGEDLQSFRGALVAGVHVVPLGEGDGGGGAEAPLAVDGW